MTCANLHRDCGPNGSGKSSLTRAVEFEGRANLLDPDAIAARINPSQPLRAAIQAGREVLTRTRTYLNERQSFAVETTLASRGTLDTMRGAKDRGFQVDLIYVALATPEENIRRVAIRVSLGGHHVPDEDVRRRYERSLANAAEAVRIADKAVVFDNSGQHHRKVPEARAGVITWTSDTPPAWLKPFISGIATAL